MTPPTWNCAHGSRFTTQAPLGRIPFAAVHAAPPHLSGAAKRSYSSITKLGVHRSKFSHWICFRNVRAGDSSCHGKRSNSTGPVEPAVPYRFSSVRRQPRFSNIPMPTVPAGGMVHLPRLSSSSATRLKLRLKDASVTADIPAETFAAELAEASSRIKRRSNFRAEN